MSRKLPYKLSDLTAQCDPDAPVPQDIIDWEKAAPVGLEQTVMGSQMDIWEAVLKFQELLSDDVTQLILFGSRARGDYRPDSDANVAALSRGDPDDAIVILLSLSDLAYKVLLSTGVRIRPFLVWETGWCDPESSAQKDTLQNIAREGITLWQA
ncbi:nucleotidyltransferase domain-containing protein [Marinobacter sp. LV10MA510-1]|uniref:nucleotidyltransferase domain-containing protein n=1 Tax=Marinobacter sp. LV10MA510-1 TaxID=1415567 RepID=UPI000BFA20B6|nr:nucleotidyltransferase domain-containing protein [Marinobacter sp. LV10MA510-1]PFG10141.1 antitoxin ChpS [Marinobacter sp. LV10MA510-1]